MLAPNKPKHISKLASQCEQPYQLTLWWSVVKKNPTILLKPITLMQIPWTFPSQKKLKQNSDGSIAPQIIKFSFKDPITKIKTPTTVIINPASVENHKTKKVEHMLPTLRERKMICLLYYMAQSKAFMETHDYLWGTNKDKLNLYSTIYEIQKHSPMKYSYVQIKESLDILSWIRMRLKLLYNWKVLNIDVSPITMFFEETLGGKEGMMKITFDELVKNDVLNMTLRPIDYTLLMSQTSYITFVLLEMILTNFIQAEKWTNKLYWIYLTTLLVRANITNYKKLSSPLQKVMKSINEIRQLVPLHKDPEHKTWSWKRGGKILIDVYFLFEPTASFSISMNDANKIMKMLRLQNEAHYERSKNYLMN